MGVRRQLGFSLIEIMIAVAILAIISSIAIPLYQGYITEARYGTALKDIRQTELILDDLASDNDLIALDGDSTAERGVYTGVGGTLILDDPATTPAGAEPWLDPWGQIYLYQRPDVNSQNYLLRSKGPDAADASDDVGR